MIGIACLFPFVNSESGFPTLQIMTWQNESENCSLKTFWMRGGSELTRCAAGVVLVTLVALLCILLHSY